MEETGAPPFHQESKIEDGLIHWRISGSLNAARYEELKSELVRFKTEGGRFFILDLQGLEEIDSRGLGFLITVQKEARSQEGRVVLVHVGAPFAPLFEMTRLNRIFEIFLDLPSAKKSFGNQNAP